MDFKDMTAVEAETKLILDAIKNRDFAATAISLIGDYEYQGLDVKAIIRTIYMRGAAKGLTAATIRTDIWKMILLFLCRGNNVDKMLARSKSDIATVIQGYKGTYELHDKVGRGGSDRLTLSRIASVFPGVTLTLLTHESISAHIPRAVSLSSTDFGDNFPKVMQTVIVASIFPKGALGVKLMKALLLYMIEENKLLSKNTSTQSDEAILTEVMKFAKASFMSSVLPFSERMVVAERKGLIVRDNVAGNILVATASFDRIHRSVDFTFVN
uniref:Nucleoprotein n=1 Tax=Phasivirus wutaiense TaxID=3052633 RepID=A0A6C0X750_9VIRU|nr:nucleocapsid protein [Phasivirus wutaiense]